MWDQYKTTLPLVLSVYPEMGQRLLEGLVNVAKRFGEFPIGYTMDDDVHRFEMQAIGLAHHTLADGLYRNYSIDWTEALKLMSDTFDQPVNQLIVFHREDLLKNTDGVLHHCLLGSLLPSVYADGRDIDDVIAF